MDVKEAVDRWACYCAMLCCLVRQLELIVWLSLSPAALTAVTGSSLAALGMRERSNQGHKVAFSCTVSLWLMQLLWGTLLERDKLTRDVMNDAIIVRHKLWLTFFCPNTFFASVSEPWGSTVWVCYVPLIDMLLDHPWHPHFIVTFS